ncbi:hypothetical protein DNTS_014627 [Danionella cerebrum]|uniref:G-protein coupled receptors family 1 profile domain-containing protein n=1 Tax=Danionella cerebrum TaxID=2873325 RepID=A0A553R8I4_9TELE|nr:hypothetical protein DNTS_014627 [Danionella translucida]
MDVTRRNASGQDSNGTLRARVPPYTDAASVFIILVVSIIILLTIVGNALVIVAVLTSRALRAPQNLFLVSLACADILVATLVIPFSLANELMGFWFFGSAWCAFYLALDVLFCTASIAHLCAISLDRYWSVTKALRYNLKRTPRRVRSMIALVWLISAVISFPPLLMTKHDELECLLNDEPWYILCSCLVSFFAPGLIMIIVYCKIYRVAKLRSSTVFVAKNGPERHASQSETGFVRKDACEPESPSRNSSESQQRREALEDIDLEESAASGDSRVRGARVRGAPKPCRVTWAARREEEPGPRQLSKRSACQQREKRFTFVLAVVMGAFVLCWFPFFSSYSLRALCGVRCEPPAALFKLFFWIGYCNSSLNPIIYTIFNRDFRKAFKKIVCCWSPRG